MSMDSGYIFNCIYIIDIYLWNLWSLFSIEEVADIKKTYQWLENAGLTYINNQGAGIVYRNIYTQASMD